MKTPKRSIQETLRLAVASIPPFSVAAEKLCRESNAKGLRITILQMQRAMAQAWTTAAPQIVSCIQADDWDGVSDAVVKTWGKPAYLAALKNAIVAQIKGNKRRAEARKINSGVTP